MKTYVLFTALSLLLGFSALSQQQGAVNSKTGSTENPEVNYSPPIDPVPINDLEGGGGYKQYFYYGDPTGMYLNQEWQKGKAAVYDGDEMSGLFRYNIYHQKLETVMYGDTFAFAKPDELNWVTIGEDKFVYASYLRNDFEVANTWFEVLCEGECELLLRRYIKYRVTDGDEDDSDDQLYKLEEYYTRTKDESGQRLQPSRKDIPLVLLDHQDELATFLKENRLNLKEKDDLVKLFTYYNSLD